MEHERDTFARELRIAIVHREFLFRNHVEDRQREADARRNFPRAMGFFMPVRVTMGAGGRGGVCLVCL